MGESQNLSSYEKGHFPVTEGHRLYYERYGTPGGIPVLYVHGGPGAGFGDDDKAFFDPEIFDVLLFEQRGAGRSEPFASLEANHTDALVEDINRLLDAFGVEKTLLFGGSWGSTLSLVYAIRNPRRVSSMLLRGIFLANRASIEHMVGGSVAEFFPEVWDRFIGHVPREERGDVSSFYLSQMCSSDEDVRERFCYEWARYELSLIKLDAASIDMKDMLEHYNYRSLAPLEAYYMANRCFLAEDYVLRNAERLVGIPTSIVHGRYDVICPAQQAYDLHAKLPGSRLHFVLAGHSASETAIREKLIGELERFARDLRGA
ncbi:MAG: prolyl aminopeptidase [Gemmatimonadetes bacterium]|nr:prolyl aminopeptidase [Gemmatimonadota bacterium]